jgi:hypothetical protein
MQRNCCRADCCLTTLGSSTPPSQRDRSVCQDAHLDIGPWHSGPALYSSTIIARSTPPSRQRVADLCHHHALPDNPGAPYPHCEDASCIRRPLPVEVQIPRPFRSRARLRIGSPARTRRTHSLITAASESRTVTRSRSNPNGRERHPRLSLLGRHLQRLPANPLSFVLALIPRPGPKRPRNSPTCWCREVHRSGLDRFHGDPGTFTDVDELLQLAGRAV